MPSANISPDIHSGKASYKIHTECLGCAHLCTKLLASFRKLKKKKKDSVLPSVSSLSSGRGHQVKEWLLIPHCTPALRAGLCIIKTLKCRRASEEKQQSAQGMTGDTVCKGCPCNSLQKGQQECVKFPILIFNHLTARQPTYVLLLLFTQKERN